MEQRSDEWYAFRQKHLGASEIASVLGLNPWKEAKELWLEKIGEKEPFKGNEHTERGSRLEPMVRAFYEDLYSVKVETPTLTYRDWPVLSASLDGLADGRVSEFKAPRIGSRLVTHSYNNEIPPYYYAQIQQQMLCANVGMADFVVYDGFYINVTCFAANACFQDRLIRCAKEFWQQVEERQWNDEKAQAWSALFSSEREELRGLPSQR